MKKLLLIICVLLGASNLFSQNVIITSIISGTCPNESGESGAEIVELYVDGSVDVTDLRIQFQFSFASFWAVTSTIGTGVVTDSFLYVVNDIEAMNREFPGIGTANNTTQSTILFGVSGGDKIRLIDLANSDAVLDIYGIDGENGENESWNFRESYVQRNDNQSPTATFDESQWTIQEQGLLFGEGVCWDEPELAQMISLQSFSGSTLSVNENEIDPNAFFIPNPVKNGNSITIETQENIRELQVFSLDGRIVARATNSNEVSFDSSGIYLLEIELNDRRSFTKKIVME